ncbi:glycosyltransferase family 2 protein [Facklamia sp. P12934]|uniref:glycosyltransferase family 2 protein n=1 Tax=Facklamia sp. P12934 TaxID=3421948 RepID=UPI003D1639CD
MLRLVSIIIPVFNSEKFISKCLDSVLSQTHHNIEIIIINDGSTDNSLGIIKKFESKDTRIRLYSTENLGVSNARNIGIKKSKGEFVTFVDSDDTVEDNLIEILVNEALKFDVDLVGCSIRRLCDKKFIPMDFDLDFGMYSSERYYNYISKNLFGNKFLKNYLPLNIVGKLFSKEKIDKYNICFDSQLRYGEDLLFTQQYLLNSNSFLFLKNLHLYNYHYNEGSATNEYRPDRWQQYILGYKKRKEIINKFSNEFYLEQLNYTLVNNSIIALTNIFLNRNSCLTNDINEMKKILDNLYLEQALEIIDISNFKKLKKILVILMRNKFYHIIYVLMKIFIKFVY